VQSQKTTDEEGILLERWTPTFQHWLYQFIRSAMLEHKLKNTNATIEALKATLPKTPEPEHHPPKTEMHKAFPTHVLF